MLLTTSLSGGEWLACIALGLVVPIVIELAKWVRRLRLPDAAAGPAPAALDPQAAVAPTRARLPVG